MAAQELSKVQGGATQNPIREQLKIAQTALLDAETRLSETLPTDKLARIKAEHLLRSAINETSEAQTHFTSSRFLLEIIYEITGKGVIEPFPLEKLVKFIYENKLMGYDFTLRSDGGLLSRGVAEDFSILATLNLVVVDEKGNIHVTAHGARRVEVTDRIKIPDEVRNKLRAAAPGYPVWQSKDFEGL